jgi:hypothetical protein
LDIGIFFWYRFAVSDVFFCGSVDFFAVDKCLGLTLLEVFDNTQPVILSWALLVKG